MLVTDKRLRLSGSRARVRMHKRGNWKHDQVGDLKVCWQATIGMEKALGESHPSGAGRRGQLGADRPGLGVAETASDEADVREAMIIARLAMSQRFWTSQE